LENKIIQLGSIAHQIVSTRDNPQRYRVYHIEGIAPALNCAQGGGLNPYIIINKDITDNRGTKWKK
jgi:hypothetical protein